MAQSPISRAFKIIEPMAHEDFYTAAKRRLMLEKDPVKAARFMLDDYKAVLIMREAYAA